MNKESVLIIAAHPDDEMLGCGGSIARHKKEGDTVCVLIMADGVGSRNHTESKVAENRAERKCFAQKANSLLGVDELVMLSYPDNRMDSVALLDIVQDIERQLCRSQPSIIYTHSSTDVNIDHRRVHEAVLAASRPQPGNSIRQLLFFETPSSTEWRPPASQNAFAPNWFVDISDFLELKLKALEEYLPELRDFPHPRSLAAVEYLARWRGACVGLAAAEAFELGRLIR